MAFDPNKLRISTQLEYDIDKYITGPSRKSYDGIFGSPQHVIKYLPPSRLKLFQQSASPTTGQKRLFAADRPRYTWGDAVYICPLKWPFSSMLYGRDPIPPVSVWHPHRDHFVPMPAIDSEIPVQRKHFTGVVNLGKPDQTRIG